PVARCRIRTTDRIAAAEQARDQARGRVQAGDFVGGVAAVVVDQRGDGDGDVRSRGPAIRLRGDGEGDGHGGCPGRDGPGRVGEASSATGSPEMTVTPGTLHAPLTRRRPERSWCSQHCFGASRSTTTRASRSPPPLAPTPQPFPAGGEGARG